MHLPPHLTVNDAFPETQSVFYEKDHHLRLHIFGLSLVYNHIVHDWLFWIFCQLSGIKKSYSGENLPKTKSPNIFPTHAEPDGLLVHYSSFGRIRQSFEQKVCLFPQIIQPDAHPSFLGQMKRWSAFHFDIKIQNLYFATANIWMATKSFPAILSAHLLQLVIETIASSSSTSWRCQLRGPDVYTASGLDNSLFATFASYFPHSLKSSQLSHYRQLSSGLTGSAILSLHVEPPSMKLAKAEMKCVINEGNVRIETESLAIGRHLLSSLSSSLLSFQPSDSATQNTEIHAKVGQVSIQNLIEISIECSISTLSTMLIMEEATVRGEIGGLHFTGSSRPSDLRVIFVLDR